jgi:hypothetical protein
MSTLKLYIRIKIVCWVWLSGISSRTWIFATSTDKTIIPTIVAKRLSMATNRSILGKEL